MSPTSKSRSLAPQTQPPPPPLPSRPPPARPPLSSSRQSHSSFLSTKNLRQQLESLDSEAQTLRASQAQLEAQLETVRTRIAANDTAVQVMMTQLDHQASVEQRAERQWAFRGAVLGGDGVLDALRRKAREDGGLKSALLAIVTNRATQDDNNMVGAALLTEMSGDVLPFLRDVAARILEVDDDVDTALTGVQIIEDTDTLDPILTEDQDRMTMMPPMRSPSVKSEASSITAHAAILQSLSCTNTATAAAADAQQETSVPAQVQTHGQAAPQIHHRFPIPGQDQTRFPIPSHDQTRYRTPTQDQPRFQTSNQGPARFPTADPGPSRFPTHPPGHSHIVPTVEATMTPRPRGPARPSPAPPTGSDKPDPASMSRLEKNFPGLLDSLRVGAELLRPKNTPPSSMKRARESVDSDAATSSTTNQGKQPVKKQRLEKEPAYTPTFAQWIKRLETLHQQGTSIADLLKCSRCKETKAKCRILSCLHLYCHKCVLALRNAAEKGNPVTGFRAFCVQPDCDNEVSGKTSVVESEAMTFLKWYDEQPAGLTSTAARLHVLNGAIADFPDDNEVQRKLSVVNAQIKQLRLTGQPDKKADLLQLVKLARKPY